MENKMKELSSESHPSLLEDGRVVKDFDKVKEPSSISMILLLLTPIRPTASSVRQPMAR